VTRRQTIPEQWLVIDRSQPSLWSILRKLSPGSGVLVLGGLSPTEQARLSRLARLRALTVVTERSGRAARVHGVRELRLALLRRTPLVLLSPMYETRSHPGWKPLSRMRAAALARLADRRLVALGGMDPRRYAKIARLGFIGWAGISAFRT
jgi:thiamine-phosphate pyrophosphorylase